MTPNNFYDTTITSLPSFSLVFKHSGMASSPNHFLTATITSPSFILPHPRYIASFSDRLTQMVGVTIQVLTPTSYVAHFPLFLSNTKKTGMIEYQSLVLIHVLGISLCSYWQIEVRHIVVSSVDLKHKERQLRLGITCEKEGN